jgi:hypothetical protein
MKMKRNTAITVASILLLMCFVALSQQRAGSELHLSNQAGTGPNAKKRIVAVLDKMVKSHETY